MKKTAVFLAAIMIFVLFIPVKASAITFTPNFTVTSEAAVLINLDKDITVYEKNPTKKMSKSDETGKGCIYILDDIIRELLTKGY